MSTQADITVSDGFFRGEDKSFVYTILQGDGVTPQNVTGWTLTFRIASSKFGAAIITKVPTLTTPLSGIVTVTLASADTLALGNQGIDTEYYYDMRRTDSGSRTEIAFGSMVIRDTWTDS